jgi:hypothetical protein
MVRAPAVYGQLGAKAICRQLSSQRSIKAITSTGCWKGAMADIKVLIVVDGIFNLTTKYPIDAPAIPYGPDAWFTLSNLIKTLRGSTSPTFLVNTASRGFNPANANDNGTITNATADVNATIKGPNPDSPTPFHFYDLDLNVYDEIWLFGYEGYNGGQVGPVGTMGSSEPGGITDRELTAITKFMEAGGGVFATGDHDGLGSAMCGRIPRVRYMRKWFSSDDHSTGRPPLAPDNWPGGGPLRADTLRRGDTDTSDVYYFDDQSDDIPQPLKVLVPTHPAVQGKSGVLKVYPDHMHEGEVIAPTGSQLTQTSATDSTLGFAGEGFTEFPTVDGHQEVPIILAHVTAGTLNRSGTLVGHITLVGEGMPCENKNFTSDNSVNLPKIINALAAYDGHTINVGRIVTDSSFHHYIDLNLLGDPCSSVEEKRRGFNASTSGQAILEELNAFYINLATWLARKEERPVRRP